MTLPIARDLARLGNQDDDGRSRSFDTPILAGLPEEIRTQLGAQAPYPPRLGKPVEFADLVAHIIRNEMLNGEVIRLDGALRMPPR
jgi:NAD(P)-dependent dehydrogenase (short-subunit alcohol dehydrogenase family)